MHALLLPVFLALKLFWFYSSSLSDVLFNFFYLYFFEICNAFCYCILFMFFSVFLNIHIHSVMSGFICIQHNKRKYLFKKNLILGIEINRPTDISSSPRSSLKMSDFFFLLLVFYWRRLLFTRQKFKFFYSCMFIFLLFLIF